MLIAIYVDRSAHGITADLGLDGQRARRTAALNGWSGSSRNCSGFHSASFLRVNVTTAKPKREDEEREELYRQSVHGEKRCLSRPRI